jgi:hypothetical protein
MGSLYACPSCACHVRASERRCPHCDAPLGSGDGGGGAKSAAAALMGLATVMTYSAGGCGSNVTSATTSTGVSTSNSSSMAMQSSSSFAMESSVFAAYAVAPSSSVSGCMETGNGTEKCNDCVTKFDCGPANTNTTLFACNMSPSGKSSLDLYTDMYDCLCGSDGKSGKCGNLCSKTCLGTGMDAGTCMTCLGGALTGTCSAQYTACKADN